MEKTKKLEINKVEKVSDLTDKQIIELLHFKFEGLSSEKSTFDLVKLTRDKDPITYVLQRKKDIRNCFIYGRELLTWIDRYNGVKKKGLTYGNKKSKDSWES